MRIHYIVSANNVTYSHSSHDICKQCDLCAYFRQVEEVLSVSWTQFEEFRALIFLEGLQNINAEGDSLLRFKTQIDITQVNYSD